MTAAGCSLCEKARVELDDARAHADNLARDLAEAHRLLQEVQKLVDLQKADIERYKKAIVAQKEPHYPERVDPAQIQLALDRVIESVAAAPAKAEAVDALVAAKSDETKPAKKRKPHGRRQIDLSGLPVIEDRITPDEVKACGGVGWKLMGVETSDRLGFQHASFMRIRTIREKWVRVATPGAETSTLQADVRIAIAPLPDYLWPRSMADTRVIAEVILAKYDYSLPLYRQERISRHRGFVIPRSTQCDWLEQTHALVHNLVDAMHLESVLKASCIATDATGAPVRARGKCRRSHVFTFISDLDHITFRHSRHHTSAAIDLMLTGYKRRLLSDASSIYAALYNRGVIGHADWVHLRRYLWRAVLTEPDLAHEGIAILQRLFAIGRDAKAVPADQRTAFRAARAEPVLRVLDAWVERTKKKAEFRGRLSAALTYYANQRDGLHRFLEDGSVSLDNNHAERELRSVKLGLDNWKHFENETGLAWYTTFRSLIASSAVQGLNPHDYLAQMLRLIPHWPKTRIIELAPKYWTATVQGLDDHHRSIIVPPWERAAAATELLPSAAA
jgi:transposase